MSVVALHFFGNLLGLDHGITGFDLVPHSAELDAHQRSGCILVVQVVAGDRDGVVGALPEDRRDLDSLLAVDVDHWILAADEPYFQLVLDDALDDGLVSYGLRSVISFMSRIEGGLVSNETFAM